jgi:hypothetical protein
MSTTSDITNLIDSILKKSWTPDETLLINKLSDNFLYYKKLLPKAVKTDIVSILTIANNIKTE